MIFNVLYIINNDVDAHGVRGKTENQRTSLTSYSLFVSKIPNYHPHVCLKNRLYTEGVPKRKNGKHHIDTFRFLKL